MAAKSIDVNYLFTAQKPYYDELSEETKVYAETKQAEMEKQMYAGNSTSSKTIFIIIGLAVAALVGIVVLKKKGII